MKKLLLSIAGFCLLASFTINTHQENESGYDILGSIAFECPECKKEFTKCMNPLTEAYVNEFSIACDKFKEGKITRDEFEKACKEADSKKSKPQSDCMAALTKCCLKETKEIMDKQNSQNKDL